MRCGKCNSEDLESDSTRGDMRCTSCGYVLDESEIASEVTFASQAVVGQFVSYAGRSLRTAKGFTREPHELSLMRAQKEIQIIASNMKLSSKEAEAAHRIYALAQQRNFIQGRKAIHVLAAALYIVCRQQRTPHLLIDFADTVGVDLFVLGSVYRKLVKLLHLQVPLIDPSLFIHRFCAKLDFKEKNNQVAMTANRIVQRMRRDWMSSGRRPTGLCGAAILIAARYHGFKRSTQQVLQVVRVCNDTIRKRLEEFENTMVASLTREEFEALSIDSEELIESNPPSFKPFEEKPKLAEPQQQLSLPAGPTSDNLSDIDDKEIDDLILSPEESKLKSLMWHHLNSDWIEKQKVKEKEANSTAKKKRKRKDNSQEDPKSPAEALRMSGKLSTSINSQALDTLFKVKETGDLYKYQSLLNKS